MQLNKETLRLLFWPPDQEDDPVRFAKFDRLLADKDLWYAIGEKFLLTEAYAALGFEDREYTTGENLYDDSVIQEWLVYASNEEKERFLEFCTT